MKSLFGKMLPFFAILVLASGIQAQTISVQPTFNNAGIEVEFTSDPGAVSVSLYLKKTGGPDDYALQHPMSKITDTNFAGSVFGLEQNTQYSIKLISSAFGADILTDFTTRQDSFATSSGTTYHIDPVNGSDGWSGTSEGAAFKTISRGLIALNGGDELLLYSGTFYEGMLSLNANKSGTPSSPTVIRNAPGHTPVVSGMDQTFSPSWTPWSGNIYRTTSTVQPKHAYVDGEHLFNFESLDLLSANDWNHFRGYHADGSHIYVVLDGEDPGTHNIDIPGHNQALEITQLGSTPVHDVHIKGIEFCYYGLADFHRAIYLNNADSNLIDNCTFHHTTPGIAFKRGSDDNTIQNCFFTESPVSSWNWFMIKDSSVADHYETGGIYVYTTPNSSIVGTVIRNNSFSNVFDGIHLYVQDSVPQHRTKSSDVYSNHFNFVGDDCIELDGAGSNTRIYENRFWDYNGGVSCAPANTGPHYIMRNEFGPTPTLQDGERVPVKFNHGSQSNPGAPGNFLYVYHNTCYSDAITNSGFVMWGYPPAGYKDHIVRNNIFAGTEFLLYAQTDTPIDLDYNLYFSSTADNFWWNGGEYASISAFYGGTGNEQHGLNGDPLLVNGPAGDYRLQRTSPAVDAGIPIPGINDGYMGTAPDLGAYEYSSATPTNASPVLGIAAASPNPASVDEMIILSASAWGSQPMYYSWDFGDSNSGTDPATPHAYASSNSYIVQLTVTNQHGTASSNFVVTIGASVETDPDLEQDFEVWGGDPGVTAWGIHTNSGWSLTNGLVRSWAGEAHGDAYCALLHNFNVAPNAALTSPLLDDGAESVTFWAGGYKTFADNYFNIESSPDGSAWTFVTNLTHTSSNYAEYVVDIGITSPTYIRWRKTGESHAGEYLKLDDIVFTQAAPPTPPAFGNMGITISSNAAFGWSCQDGEEFSVMYTVDLIDTNWIEAGIATGVGATASFTDTSMGSATSRFYRLRRL